MAIPLNFLGNFTTRTLESLRRFRAADPPAVDPDLDGWNRTYAAMTPEERERWDKMNQAEARRVERLCETCGGHAENCKCDYYETFK